MFYIAISNMALAETMLQFEYIKDVMSLPICSVINFGHCVDTFYVKHVTHRDM